jgi:hypothetical protein
MKLFYIFLIFVSVGCKKSLINICYKNNLLPEAFTNWSKEIVFIRCVTKFTAKGLWSKEVFEEAVKELEDYHKLKGVIK